jgi:hypothetical protein
VAVKTFRTRPYLARHETIGALQEIEVIIVEDVRLALEIELGERERAAFERPRMAADDRLEVAFVGDPDAAEVADEAVVVGVRHDPVERGPGQAPPLRAEVRRDPRRNLPRAPQAALGVNPDVEEQALVLP